MGSSLVLPSSNGGGGVSAGAFASRPAAGNAGSLFLPTNGPTPAYDTGAAWKANLWGFECTKPPVLSELTQHGGGAETTLAGYGDGISFKEMGIASTGFVNTAIVKALPAGNYTVEIGVEVAFLIPLNYQQIGICLTDGTKFVTFIIQSQTTDRGVNVGSAKWNTIASYSAGYTITQSEIFLSRFAFFKIYFDGETLHFSYSRDGVLWQEYQTTSVTDFINPAPTHYGFWFSQSATAIATTRIVVAGNVLHWKES